MSYNRKRFTLSDRDSLTLEPRHLLTTAHVASFAPAIPSHVGSPLSQPSATSNFVTTDAATSSAAHPSTLSTAPLPAFVSPVSAAAPKTFTTLDNAAKDWGATYNKLSIDNNKEYGSSIYQNADGTYSYSDPAVGGKASVTPAPPPAGKTAVGVIHSHAAYDPAIGLGNEHFSPGDIAAAKAGQLQEYLTTPSGELLLYDLGSGNEVLISTTMPSDPNDPNRH